VFKLDAAGNETVLHSFARADGANPYPGVIRDAKGNLYGTTDGGGTQGFGTVFMIDTNGKETVLHNFPTGADDGYFVWGGLVRDAKGNLYGTTFGGGAGGCSGNGCGTVFKLSPSGKETVLFSFDSTDGDHPEDTLIRDQAGNLYGTTIWGNTRSGYGVAFMLDPQGKETVLHAFANSGKDGASPSAGLFRDKQGNLYGTTDWDAYNSCGCGTIFRLSQ